MASQTANGYFDYNQEFFNFRLDELIYLTHKELSTKLKWKYFPLKRGSFGYDNMATSIGLFLENIKSTYTLDEASDLVHKGWCINYIWWKYCKPYELLPELYHKPSKPLNDKRRNLLANTKYEDLPEKDKETNKIIAKYLFQFLLNKDFC